MVFDPNDPINIAKGKIDYEVDKIKRIIESERAKTFPGGDWAYTAFKPPPGMEALDRVKRDFQFLISDANRIAGLPLKDAKRALSRLQRDAEKMGIPLPRLE